MKRDRRSLLLLPLFLVLLISHLALPHRAAAEGLMESRSGISKRENTGACPRTQSPCGHVPVDVVYVIDSSNSVHHPDFERAKNIIVQLIEFFYLEKIPFAASDVRLAIMQFGSEVRTELTFDESITFGENIQGFRDRVNSIKRLEGLETNTAKALEEATAYFERNQRKNARKYTIVITDGQCSEQYVSRLYTNAAALRGGSGKDERLVWSIGVGKADLQELKKISGDENRMLSIPDFKRLAEIKKFFHDKIVKDWRTNFCNYQPNKCGRVQADIVFVIDSSNSISYGDFDRAKEFIIKFLEFFDTEKIPFSSDDCRLAVIQFGEEVKEDLTFEASTKFGSDYRELGERIKSIKRRTGLETNTAKALAKVNHIFESNKRKNARKYTIVITDGHCSQQYLSSLYTNAAELRVGQVDVWGVGVGKADMKELEEISGNQTKVLGISDFKKYYAVWKFFHQKIQNDWRRNGVCQECCLDNGKCGCHPPKQLGEDGRTCYEPKPPARPSPCGHVRADIVFVIDSSNSVSWQDFDGAKIFIINFIEFFRKEKIPFSSDQSRLSVIQFGKIVKEELTFEESTKFGSDFQGLTEHIKSIKRLTATKTNTAKALAEAAQIFERNKRENANKHAIVITDGECSHEYLTDLKANAAELRGAQGRDDPLVWGIGVGKADLKELQEITRERENVFHVSDYEKHDEVKRFYREKIQRDWRMKGRCEHKCTADRVCACDPGFQLTGNGFDCDRLDVSLTIRPPTFRSGKSTSSAASSLSSYFDQFWPTFVLRLVFSTLPAWILF